MWVKAEVTSNGIPLADFGDEATLLESSFSFDYFVLGAPSIRTFMCIPIFLLASGMQHDCHAHLASLKHYTLPEHPMFQMVVSPHYFAECIIYLSLTLVAAPKGQLFNRTLLCALVFVTVNLSVTADMSLKWYVEKFGKDKVGEDGG